MISKGITCPCRFLTDVPVVRNLNRMVMVDAVAGFPTVFPTSYSPCSPLWHLSCSGEDINGEKIPHLAGPPASGGSLWHLPLPGVDINGGKGPYLARMPTTDIVDVAGSGIIPIFAR